MKIKIQDYRNLIKNFIKNFRDFSLLIISNHAGIQTKSYNLNFLKVISWIGGYTAVIVFIVFTLFAVTPLKFMFVSNESAVLEQHSRIIELNKKVSFLSHELDQILSMNKKLKNAIMLGDSANIRYYSNLRRDSLPVPKNANSNYLLGVIRNIYYQYFSPAAKKDVYFIFPVENHFISRGFNPNSGHMGLDFPVREGMSVYASSSGFVVFSGYTAGDGNMLILSHKNNYITVYKHCSVLLKKTRDRVIQGEAVAVSGNTGLNTSGPHLHFELWENGLAIDPLKVLSE